MLFYRRPEYSSGKPTFGSRGEPARDPEKNRFLIKSTTGCGFK